MNKIFTKVAGVALGLSLAIGVGVGVGTKAAVNRVDAADVKIYTLDGTITGGSAGYGSESSITQDGVSWNVTGNTTMNPWRIGGQSISNVDRDMYTTSPLSSDDVNKVIFTYGGSSGSITHNSFSLIVSSNADFSDPISTLSGATYTQNGSVTFNRPSGKSWANAYFKFSLNVTVSKTSNKYIQFAKAEFYKYVEDQDITGFDIDDIDLHPGKQATISVNPIPAAATIPSDTTYSLTNVSPSGCVSLNTSTKVLSASAVGSAKLTISSSSKSISKTVNVTVNAYPSTGLTLNSDYALIGATSNYELRSVNTSGSTPYGEVVAFDSVPSCSYPVTVVSGVQTGTVAFSFGGSYLSWSSGNSLTTSESIDDNSTWVVINENNSYSVINYATYEVKGALPRYLKYNSGSTRFACYESGQQEVSFYEIQNNPLEDFTIEESTLDLFVGRNATLTVTYTPADAVDKDLNWSSTDDSIASVENGVVTANGVGTATISASHVIGGVTVTRQCVVTVTEYAKTHDKVTSVGALFNGAKVVLANSELGKVSAQHTGGNNLPAVDGIFDTDGSSLSLTSTSGEEYTIWQATVDEMTGWVFYGDGYYLSNTSSSDKSYFKQSAKLVSKCLYNISIADGVATITSVDENVGTRNNLRLNGTLFNNYASGYSDVELFIKAASSDANIVAGYEDFFLHMDAIDESDKGTGKCTSNGLYDNAKEVFNSTLTPAQRNALSEGARARLAAWAEANGDEFDSGTGLLVEKANSGFEFSGNNNSMTLITIIAVVSLMSFAALIVLKKKKLHK